MNFRPRIISGLNTFDDIAYADNDVLKEIISDNDEIDRINYIQKWGICPTK